MPRKDPRIDAYIRRAAPFAQPILTHLRRVVHEGCPDVEEDLKWSFPHFDYKGMLCSMAAFKQHARLGFWKGALLAQQGLPKGDETALAHFGHITCLADLPGDKALLRIVRAAAKLNDDGVRIERTKPIKSVDIPVPDAFMTRLRADQTVMTAFEALSPSHRREYVDWIVEAKTGATSTRRIDTALEWIAHGKSRNWKYDRKNG
ncbi:MAG: YdeI/OmpD-associated family protein [Acidobacteriota bacterium]